MLRFVITVCISISSFSKCWAQYELVDSISSDHSLTAWYDQQVGLTNTVIQQGERFILTRKSSNSHAYYASDRWLTMNVFYCGQLFQQVSAIYNLEEDALIIENLMGKSPNSPIKLTAQQVGYFEFDGNYFEYLDEQVGWYGPGFYKVVYRSERMALVRKVSKRLVPMSGRLTYEQRDVYYLLLDDRYHAINKIGSLTKLFPEHKKEIRMKKRTYGIKDLDSPQSEDQLGRLIEYCDKLTQR